MHRVIRRLAALFTAAVTATALTSAPAAPASAATIACAPVAGSPACQVWTGRVAWVADGDTVLVDIAGDGTTTPVSVRLIGVQAMEQTVYSPTPARRRGECHSLPATARVEQLVKAGGGVVRLTAQHASSISRGRPLRSMAVRVGGVWRDIGLDLVRNGHGIALSFGDEWAWDRAYRVAQARAAQDRINLFDTDVCGSGPAQSASLDLWVNSDAEGSDDANLNGEWIRVGNNSGFRVPVGGWWVRDSGLRRWTFPAGTVLPARGAVYVHVGKGTATATHQHWGLTTPIFENATTSPQAAGDGAYLFDPRGDLRAWTQYPCVLGCTSRLAGKVALEADYASVEEVRVVNTGTAPVDLYRHVLVSRPYLYPFTTHTVLRPGEVLRLRTTTGTNTTLTRYWGKTGSILNNTGDGVSLRTAEETVVACVHWGNGSC